MLPSAFATASAPGLYPYAAQWLACELPYRRFALTLADDDARLGADVVRYSFIVSDFHRLLLAGLPAHCEKFWTLPFHGRFREECLNEHWFLTLDDARETIENWRLDYNVVSYCPTSLCC